MNQNYLFDLHNLDSHKASHNSMRALLQGTVIELHRTATHRTVLF